MNPEVSQQMPVEPPQTPMVNVPEPKKGINLVAAIAIAVAIALVLAGVSLQIFLNSDTREINSLTEKAADSALEEVLSDAPDESSTITSDDLSDIELDVKSSADSVSSEDFESSEVTDAALGL